MKDRRTAAGSHFRGWGTLAILILVGSFLVGRGYAAVDLISFSADGQSDQVVLDWETATELDNAGFYVNRSSQQADGYTRISPFVPGEGDSITGARYRFIDTDVQVGVTYWYKLESIDFSQNSSFYEPPVQAIPGQVVSTPTSTRTPTRTATGTVTPATPTRTFTPTATRTATAAGATATHTPTQVGATAYPAPPTAIIPPNVATATLPGAAGNPQITADPQQTASAPTVVQAGEILTGTATLLPLPEITLQFPNKTQTSRAPAGKAGDAEESGAEPPSARTGGWFTPERTFFILFIVMIWALLGGWFFISMRKME